MTKYIQTQTRKMIGAFAGVGALVEDTKGVIEVEPIDKWLFFTYDQHAEENQHINDNRLLHRLKNEKGFPNLKTLVKMPVGTTKSNSGNQYVQPSDWQNVATAHYFPCWMFCSQCHRLKSLKDWWKKWQEVIDQYERNKSNEAAELFIPPKCGYCYEKSKNENKRKWVSFRELIQVRFIMTSSDGKLRDIPWDKWITFKDQAKSEDDETVNLSSWDPCCSNADLYYIQGRFEDLNGIIIKCVACKKRASLGGLFGLSFFSDTEKKYRFKTVLRSSNSVYYPILAHSLYLPSQSEILDSDQIEIDKWDAKGKGIKFIFDDVLDKKYSKEKIQIYIDSKDSNADQQEVDYRRKEYQFILDNEAYRKNEFIFSHKKAVDLNGYGITHLVKISRLKMTTVQTGFTRQQPLDIDLFLSEDIDDIKPKYTSKKAKNTEYLMGVENFGEGIFISLDKNKINQYILQYKEQLNELFDRSKDSPLFKRKFIDINHLGKFVCVHSLSHLLMKELEFSCGYPTVSLSERIFVDNRNMQGVLIYTVGGMEGSYGGLASQAEPDKFKRLLQNAKERAKDCASDPICLHSQGQGVGDVNLAACYSCALVAENACESFNSFLDRKSILGE